MMTLGRKAKWTLVLAAGLVLMFALVHTPPAKKLARAVLVRAASSLVEGRVSIDALDYQLWRGAAQLHDVVLEPNIMVVPFNFAAERVEVRASPSLKISSILEGPELTFIDFLDTPASDYTPLLPRVGTLRVVDGALRFQDHDATGELVEWVALEGVAIDLSPDDDEHRASIHALAGHAYNVRFGAVDADLLLRPGHLRAASASIFKDDSFVRVTGELDFTDELQAELDSSFALDGALARLLNEELDIDGVLAGRTRVNIVDGESTVDSELTSNALGWAGLSAEDIEAEATYTDGIITLRQLRASGYGGEAQLRAEITLDGTTRNRFELSWSDIDSGGVVAALADERLPLAARIGGNASLTLAGFDLESAAGNARVDLEPGSDIVGTVEAALDSSVVSVHTQDVSIPTLGAFVDVDGIVTTAGGVDLDVSAALQNVATAYERSPVPIEGAVSATGNLSGSVDEPRLNATLASSGLRIDGDDYELAGDVTGSSTELTVARLTLEGNLGTISASGSVPLSDAGTWKIDADLGGVAEGTLNLSGPADDPDFSTHVVVTPELGRFALTARKQGREIHVDELTGAIDDATLSARGSYDLDGDSIDASIAVRDFRPSELATTAEYLYGFDAVVGVDATIAGSPRAPSAQAAVRVDKLTYNETPLPSVELSLTGSGGTIGFAAARDDGARLATGELELSESFPLHAEINLAALPISEMMQRFHLFLYRERARWTASGTAVIDVPLAEPSALVFRADVDSVEARFANALAQAAPFTVDGNARRVRIEGFNFHGIDNELELEGDIPLSAEAGFDLTAEGKLDLRFLQLLEPALEIEGQALLSGTLRGSLETPELDGRLSITNGVGAWRGITWADLSLSATAQEDRLSELTFDADVLGGRIELDGHAPFVANAGTGRIEFRVIDVDVSDIDFLQSAANGSLVVGLNGAIDLPSPDIASWSGAGELERVSGRAADAVVELAQPAPWRLSGGSLEMPGARFEGRGGALDISIRSIELINDFSVDATANGVVSLAFANAFIASSTSSATATGGTRVDGRLELSSSLQRVDGELVVNGNAKLVDGRLAMVDPGFTLSDVNAVLSLDDDTVTVSELSARAGNGTLRGGGSVDISTLSRPLFNLETTANAVPLEIMDGLRAEVTGSVRLVSTEQEPRLSAELTLDRGLLTRELLGDDNSFSAQTVVLADPTREPGPLDGLVLNVTIATAQNLRVDNSTMQLEAAGNISVGGTIAAPELGGFITVQSDGTFNIARNKFQVIRGRIDLTGFPLVSPNIQLLALTRVGTTTINVDLEGDLEDMRTRLTAPENPELTEGDLASLLVTGRTLENASEGGQQMASTWMMSSLANLMHDGLGDVFSFGPAPGAGPLILAEESDPTSRLTLGVPVTDRLSVTYSIALDSTERRLWILDYRVARNVWLRGTQENSSDYGVGLSQRFSLDFRSSAGAGRTLTSERRVANVEIEGDTRLAAGLIEQLEIRAGDRYNYWTARDAAVELEDSLVKAGFRSAVVDVDADVDETAPQDDIGLRFVVNVGKPIDFVWRGDEPPKNAKKNLEQDWNGRVPEEFLLADVSRRGVAELNAGRYYSASIETFQEELDGRRNIVFNVVRGPRADKTELRFIGNTALPDGELAAALPNVDTSALFLLLSQRAELERGVRLRYATEGYLDVVVGAVQTSYNPETKVFAIEIPVDERSRTEILSVDFEGELALDTKQLSRELGIEPGTPVDFPEIRRGQTRLRTLYRNQGFPDVELRALLQRTRDGLEVRILVDEGARAHVGNVRIVGNRRTHQSVIRNQLTFATAAPIRIIDFQETQRRLYDLGIFRSADVRPDPSHQGRGVQDVIIQVVERADVDVSYGLRYNVIGSEQSVSTETEPRSTGVEVVSRINFVNQTGHGTNFGLSVFLQRKFQLYRATFRVPTFAGHRIVTEFFADTERDDERFGVENFETRSNALTFQQTKRLTDARREKFALQWNVRFGRFRSRRFDENGVLHDIDTNRPRVGISLIEDRRDSFANPTRGRFWNITVQAVPEILGSDVAYVRLYGQFFYTYPLTESLIWASGIRMGAARGNRQLLLMEDRFQAGGANSVRGFQQNTLGPSVFIEETEERLYIGGQAVGVFNQELRFPIYKSLHGGVYWDAGNIFPLANQFHLSDLRHSVGAGLRFVLPFGAIRFDWAEPLNAQPGDDTTRFHFSFGYAF